MASQITHIVYGEKVREKLLIRKQIRQDKYFIGNVFPDIRYLGTISREETHPKDPVIEKLNDFDNSFELGVYVHALVDWEREKALDKLGMYDLIEKNQITSTALKLLEDEITCSLFNRWGEVIPYFDQILEEETDLVSEDIVYKWHKLLKTYLSREKKAADLIREIGFDNKVIVAVTDTMGNLRNNKRITSIISKVYEEFL